MLNSRKILQNLKALMICSAALLLLACGNDSPPEGAARPERPRPDGMSGASRGMKDPNLIPSVEVVAAQVGTLPLEERLTGRVIAHNQTAIFPEVSGPIVEIMVNNGDRVTEGDALVRIRDTEFRETYQQAVSGAAIAAAQTRQAQANLKLLQNQLKRITELAQRNLDSQAGLDDIRAQVEVAEANVDLRKAQEAQARSQMEERQLQLDNAVVRAPVSGWVGQRNAERGQQVSGSTQLFIIGDLSRVEIEIPITEKMLAHLVAGTAVDIRSDSWPDKTVTSTIARISPFIDSNTLRTQGYIELENPEGLFRSGMFVSVDVLYGNSEQAVQIPNTAIYRHPRSGREGVFVMEPPGSEFNYEPVEEGGGAPLTAARPLKFVPLQIVASGRMATAVRGIKEGDWVVTVGKELVSNNVAEAKARLVSWEKIMEMQKTQSRDLFKVIDKRQSRQAALPGE